MRLGIILKDLRKGEQATIRNERVTKLGCGSAAKKVQMFTNEY